MTFQLPSARREAFYETVKAQLLSQTALVVRFMAAHNVLSARAPAELQRATCHSSGVARVPLSAPQKP